MLKLATIPLILAGLFAAPHAGAQGHHGAPGGGIMGGMLGKLLNPQAIEELELTDDQVNKLEDLQSAHEKEMLDAKQNIERARLNLKELMKDDDPSESKIKAKIREIGSLRTDMQLTQVDVFFAVRNILTDEQAEKLQSLRHGGRAGGHDGRRGSHPGSGHGPGRGGGSGNLGEPGGPMIEEPTE